MTFVHTHPGILFMLIPFLFCSLNPLGMSFMFPFFKKLLVFSDAEQEPDRELCLFFFSFHLKLNEW